MKRPFEDAKTSELKFAIGVGEAGLTIWSKRSKKYAECVAMIQQMKDELRTREEKAT